MIEVNIIFFAKKEYPENAMMYLYDMVPKHEIDDEIAKKNNIPDALVYSEPYNIFIIKSPKR